MTPFLRAALLALACCPAQAELDWIAVEENHAAFPAVVQAEYDREHHAFSLGDGLCYRPTVDRDMLIEIFTAIAASPAVQTRLNDRFARKGALDPDSRAMRALRAAAWEIRRQTGLMEHDDYALVFTAPRFETHEGAILAREGGFEIVRIWGRLPIALSRTTPQLAAGRSAVETIAFARGLRSRGIALAPLVAAMEGPAAPRNLTRILVLGFEPYGGRSSNASAIAARALDGAADVVAVRMLPVQWDRAAQEALAHIDALGPDFVLAFGEHAAGWFHIETLVYNRRWTSQMDNAGHTASTHFFAPQGPAAYDWPGQPYHLASALAEKGYPLRVSRDAGREQCAGVLYALAARQTETPDFHFAFMHVPRVGEPLAEGNGPVRCRPDFLRSFARECLREIRNRRE